MIHFDLKDTIRLLTGERVERFRFERAVKLYQMQVWMLFPETFFVAWATLIAAVKLLHFVEEEIFIGEEDARVREERPGDNLGIINLGDRPPQTLYRIAAVSRDNLSYRALHDNVVAPLGGLCALLDAPQPRALQQMVVDRLEKVGIVTKIFDYRLRYMKSGIAHSIRGFRIVGSIPREFRGRE